MEVDVDVDVEVGGSALAGAAPAIGAVPVEAENLLVGLDPADDAAAGRWVPLATLKALAASAPGRSCGLKGVTAVSFGPGQNPIAAGSCVRPGAAGVFTDAGGTWRSAGLTLPGNGPGMGTVRVLGLTALRGGNAALLAISHPGGNSLLAAWWDGTRWTVSAPVTADGVRALGFGPGGSAWLLLDSGRAETIADPKLYERDPSRVVTLSKERADAAAALATAEEQWYALSAEYESATSAATS